MAVRRTNNLSSEISLIDRRLKTLESSASTGTAGTGVSASADDENPPASSSQNLRSNSAPFQYKRVYDAYIYGPKRTGFGSRAELYFKENPEVKPNEYVRVQGINGNSAAEIDISSSDLGYRVFATDTPPWDDRDNRGEGVTGQFRAIWRDTPDNDITHTVFYNPVVVPPGATPEEQKVRLITTRRIDSVSASGTTVTVNFNANHRFQVGDVLYWDVPDELLDGYADKLFKVATIVDSNTVTYQLTTPLASPISLSGSPINTKFVYPVAQRYVAEGTTWVDTSVEPNRIYIWKDYRWYDTAEPVENLPTEQDGIAPSPVTNLAGTSEVPSGSATPVINLTWTPPTTRSNGATLSGLLDGYEIWYKRAADPIFKKEFVKDGGAGVNSYQIKDATLIQNATYNIRVYTVDILAQVSTPATVNVLTAKYSEVLNAPSKPLVSSRLGTITVTWDGNDSTGNLPVRGVIYVEYHQSTNPLFIPSSSTLIGTTLPTLGGDYQVVADLSYGSNYYFKLVFVRRLSETELDKSDPSVVSDAIQVAPLVNTDIIANTISGAKIEPGSITASDKIIGNTITGALIQALTIEAGNIKGNAITADKIDVGAITGTIVRGDVIQTSNTGARVELRSTGIYAINSSNVPVLSFDTATSTLTIGGYATSQQLSTVESVAISANSIAVTANNTANSANSTAISASGIAVTANTTAGTAITRINAGDITVTKAKAVGAINEGVDPGNTTTISGGSITTGSIDADRISVNTTYTGLLRTGAAGTNRIEIRGSTIANPGIVHLDGSGGSNFRFYANGFSYLNNLELVTATLSGTLTVSGNVSGGTFTGGTFRTALSGKRVLISGSSNSVVFFDENGSEAGRIQGSTSGGSNLIISGPSTPSISIGIGSIVVDGGLSTSGTSNILAAGRLGQVTFTAPAATTAAVHRSSTTTNQYLFGAAASDVRYKKDIVELQNSLQLITSLRPVKFRFITEEDGPTSYGLIAQEVQPFFDENDNVVNSYPDETGEPYLSIEYTAFIAPLIGAVKELSRQNEELQARIAALEGTT
jgi:hypothetical protein